jgi:hypothetical protein
VHELRRRLELDSIRRDLANWQEPTRPVAFDLHVEMVPMAAIRHLREFQRRPGTG